MNATIEIVVHPDGTSRLETKGFVGTACKQASEQLERALGQKTAEALTAEFYQSQSVIDSVREGQT
jgi:hypothetical protein